MDKIIVDSDILIDFSRNLESAATWIEAAEHSWQITISSITEMELLLGSRDKAHLREVHSFLSRYQIISINERISEQASELVKKYCLSHRLLIPDALIAATAIVNDLALATINKRDFRFIDGLRLANYP